MGGYGGVNLLAVFNTQRHDHLNVDVTLAKNQVFFAQRGFIWGDKNPYHLVFYLIAQFVGLILVQANYKIAQAIGVSLNSFFRLQELNGRWHCAGKNRCGVLFHLIEH